MFLECLFAHRCKQPLRSSKRIEATSVLCVQISGMRGVLARAAGRFFKAVLCALAQLRDSGLCLWKNLVEVGQLLFGVFWVVPETVA